MSDGVDYDKRCKKFRARITRNCCVYHLGYYKSREEAVAARKEAERRYNKGKKFKYLHSYSTNTSQVEVEDDPYLFFVSLSVAPRIDDPNRNLRLAVLIQAVKDYLTDRNKKNQKSARDWFAGKVESEPTFSFLEIIELFGISESEVKRYLRSSSRNKKQALRSMGRRLVRMHSTAVE